VVVAVATFTVTTVPLCVVSVNVLAPMDFTVPTAAGLAPPNPTACLGFSPAAGLPALLVVAAPAIPPVAIAKPKTTEETPAI
jgi:hypothetical protein